MTDLQKSLQDLRPEHDFFIGIDSDGCVFDTMEVKQKEFFIPNALKYFGLYPISGIVRRTWEFINLYSIHRGGNRFISLLKVFEILENDEKVKASGVKLPSTLALKEWIAGENRLGNATLRKYLETNNDPGLVNILTWSEAVNTEISAWLRNIPPFPSARKAIESVHSLADIIIVSQTPLDAIIREWEENDLRKYVRIIAAQEHGTKTEHLDLAAKGKYTDDKILMIGDAKGDLDAARNNRVLFYPIIPGHEDESWNRFYTEGTAKFFNGDFRGSYENSLEREFLAALPEKR